MNQTLEAFGNQLVQLDALGDERFEVDFALFHQFDGFGVVVAVGDGAAHVQLFHHDAVDVDGGGMAPNGYDDDFRGRAAGFDTKKAAWISSSSRHNYEIGRASCRERV